MNTAIKMINQKKSKNNKPKMASYQKQARKGMKGLVIKWCDSDPFSENGDITNASITHKNPTQRIIVDEMWKRCSKWILNTEFMWCVIMRVIFADTERGDKIDEYQFDFTCTLRGAKSDILNDAMEAALKESMDGNNAFPDGHKNKGIYKLCDFEAVIVGV